MDVIIYETAVFDSAQYLFMKKDALKKTKNIAITAMLVALYLVLAALLKVPVAGHITVDLGYVALMVACCNVGAVQSLIVGAMGAFLESAIMAQRGVSIGWILMNAIVGYICGMVLTKASKLETKKIIVRAVIVVPLSMALGVVVKTFFDCIIYDLPVAVKIPTAIVACVLDSLVMLVFGLPLSLALRNRL